MEFNRYAHLPRLSYWHVLWSSSILFNILLCISIKHIMFKYLHRYTYICVCIHINCKEKASKSSIHAFCGCVCVVKKNYRPVCIVAFWWSHHMKRNEKDNQESEKVSLATLPSFLFIVIEINKRAWWLIVDTDDRAQMLTKQVTLYDYCYSIMHTQHQSV